MRVLGSSGFAAFAGASDATGAWWDWRNALMILIACVLMQSGKDKRLSGTIAGGAETFFGKTKGKTTDKLFSRLTTILSFVFKGKDVLLYPKIFLLSTENYIKM